MFDVPIEDIVDLVLRVDVGAPVHFRAAWLRLKQTDLIPGKGQFR